MQTKLKEIIAGLTFPSEADEPFELFEADVMPAGTVYDLDTFINSLIVTQEWDGPDEMKDKRKFEELRTLLKAETKVPLVVHSGDTYYFAGAVGLKWIGVKAKAVET
jgi:hypothetical protein